MTRVPLPYTFGADLYQAHQERHGAAVTVSLDDVQTFCSLMVVVAVEKDPQAFPRFIERARDFGWEAVARAVEGRRRPPSTAVSRAAQAQQRRNGFRVVPGGAK